MDASLCSDGSEGVLEDINNLLEISNVFTKDEWKQIKVLLCSVISPFYEIF